MSHSIKTSKNQLVTRSTLGTHAAMQKQPLSTAQFLARVKDRSMKIEDCSEFSWAFAGMEFHGLERSMASISPRWGNAHTLR
jgi:hypothetical protein